jgi:hypothetical protein
MFDIKIIGKLTLVWFRRHLPSGSLLESCYVESSLGSNVPAVESSAESSVSSYFVGMAPSLPAI